MEEVIKHFLSKIFVTIPVEIVKVNAENSLCDVKPLLFDKLELPIIVECPFLQIGNGSTMLKFKVEKGQKFMALFSQLDLSNYIANGEIGQINSVKKFSMTNAVILPIQATTKKDLCTVPEVPFEISGDVKIIGNMEVNGNVKINGKTEVEQEVISKVKMTAPVVVGEQDVTFGGVSGKGHIHPGVQPGQGTTGGPQ